MKLNYDLHIHTALSPCGANDMTPNNIVNMALINELDVIAVTDHNACENINAVIEVAKATDLLVIPGLEIETKEEIHILCLFSDINDVYNVHKLICEKLPNIKNKKDLFGDQLIFNKEDDIIGYSDRLLAFATDISIDKLHSIINENNGVFIPAHIDRPSYSIVSNLGMIPNNMPLSTIEISRFADFEAYSKKYHEYLILQSSDAHDLGYIGICNRNLEVPERTVQSIIKVLRQG